MPSGFFKFDRFTRLVLLADAAPPHIALSTRGACMLRLMTARHLSYCALCAGAYRWVPRLGFGLELIGPVECVLRAPKPDRVRDVGSEVRPSTSRGPRSQAEHVLWAPEPGRARPAGPEARSSARRGLRSQAKHVLWAPKSGRARPAGPEARSGA